MVDVANAPARTQRRATRLLDVEGLEAFYGQAQVLFGLSFDLYGGEVCGADRAQWRGQDHDRSKR